MSPRIILGVLAVAAAAWAATPTLRQQPSDEPPTIAPHNPRVIPGRFIVTLRDTSAPSRVAADHGVRPDFVYARAVRGFAGTMSDAARNGLMRDRRVERVEPDEETWATSVETNPPWGLDRIDQRMLPLTGTFSYASTGAGVTAYIIDTGIRFDHVEFGGRARTGYDAITFGGTAADCNGHGTHVAGTVGGTNVGVAKHVSLVALRVLGCDGSGAASNTIAAIDWILGHLQLPAVANMSLGGGASTAEDDAVKSLIAAGVTVVVAAGNGNSSGVAQDACKSSPARVAPAITISAANRYDKKPSWANYGNCVDWFAPGTGIVSAYYTASNAYASGSGTSQATPHVTGVVAQYLQLHPAATPKSVRDALYNATTKNVVLNSHTTNHHLLFESY